MTGLNKARLAMQDLEDKIITYQDWAEKVLGTDYRDVFSDEYIRRAAKVFSIFLKHMEDVKDGEDTDAELKKLLDKIKAERIKLSTANLEYNAIQRVKARNDMFAEQVVEAINRLEPIVSKEPIDWRTVDKEGTTALLCISDFSCWFDVRNKRYLWRDCKRL